MHTKRPLRLPAIAAALTLAACGGGGGNDHNSIDGEGRTPLPVSTAPPAGIVGDGRMAELLEWARASQEIPGMSAVLVRNGQVAELTAVGKRSADAAVLVTTSDQWIVGSVTKAMTATLAAVLVEDGAIGWDTTTSEVWPEWSASMHADLRGVTLSQLLSHTAGLPFSGEPDFVKDAASGTLMEKRRRWAEQLLSSKPDFPVGTWNYSNMGYVVAGAMLEARTGTPWETLLSTRVYAPLGMTHSGFGPPGTPGALDEPLGHNDTNSGFKPIPVGPGADFPKAVAPAAGVHTTLADYARYLMAHIEGERGVPGLLSVESFHTLHQVVAANYALGWWQQQFGPLPGVVYYHAGTNELWYAKAWFSPANNVGLFVTANAAQHRASTAIDIFDEVMRRRVAASP